MLDDLGKVTADGGGQEADVVLKAMETIPGWSSETLFWPMVVSSVSVFVVDKNHWIYVVEISPVTRSWCSSLADTA